MEISPLVTQWLIVIILALSSVALGYLIAIMVRVYSLLERIEKVISYTDRVGSILSAWESIPKTLLHFILEYLPSPKSEKKISKK